MLLQGHSMNEMNAIRQTRNHHYGLTIILNRKEEKEKREKKITRNCI